MVPPQRAKANPFLLQLQDPTSLPTLVETARLHQAALATCLPQSFLSASLPPAPSPGFPCPAHAQHRRAAETHGRRRPRRAPAAVPGAQPCRRVPLPAETQALGVFLGEESRGAHDPEHPAEREYVTGEAERSRSPARRRWDGRSGGNVFPVLRSQQAFACCSLEQDCCLWAISLPPAREEPFSALISPPVPLQGLCLFAPSRRRCSTRSGASLGSRAGGLRKQLYLQS